jgi:N-methylhydantoinase B
MERKVDLFTVAVVAGYLASIVRQMTITMAQTARTTIFKVSHDYSNTILDWVPRLILQGEDELPVHLGPIMLAAKEVASYFGDDIHPGDIVYHNDPATGGSHLQDMTALKPIFWKDELLFWTACKAHMIDTGGMTAGGYHPLAQEIYQEGIRISPVKIHERGKERTDVINLILANVRQPTTIARDLRAQLAAITVGERRLLKLLEKYGKEVVKNCVEEILDAAERKMRAFIRSLPDGVYEGSCMVHDDGHGSGDLEIKAKVSIKGDELNIDLDSPKQTRSYNNCYPPLAYSMCYFGVLTHSRMGPPFNEGSYRPIKVNLGPKGTITNAMLPAACSLATSIVASNIQAAIRVAMSKAIPELAAADWSHATINHPTGLDPRTGQPYTFFLISASTGGMGAVRGMDGWSGISGSPSSAGAAYVTDIEDVEYEFPIHFHRWELRTDSGCAGKWRGGAATVSEIEPVNHSMDIVAAGVGDKFPPTSLLGAKSKLIEQKLHRRYLIGKERTRRIPPHSVVHVDIGERVVFCHQGGGGVGDPFERDLEAVRSDVLNEIVSIKGAKEDYGVVIDPETLQIDLEETKKLRGTG